MKNIRLFGIVLLVALLSLSLDVLACDDLEAAVQTATTARDNAKAALDDLTDQNWFQTLINLAKSLGLDDDITDGDLGQDVWDLLPEAAERRNRQQQINTTRETLADAESALTRAQASYDLCLLGERIEETGLLSA